MEKYGKYEKERSTGRDERGKCGRKRKKEEKYKESRYLKGQIYATGTKKQNMHN